MIVLQRPEGMARTVTYVAPWRLRCGARSVATKPSVCPAMTCTTATHAAAPTSGRYTYKCLRLENLFLSYLTNIYPPELMV